MLRHSVQFNIYVPSKALVDTDYKRRQRDSVKKRITKPSGQITLW